MFFYIFSCLLPECRFEWGGGGKSEEWPCAGLRRIEGPFWVDWSPCSRILITKLWGSLLLLCFFSWGPSAQELAQSQVVLEKYFNLVCDNYFFRLETDCLVERPFIYWLLWSWSKSRQLWRKNSRDRKVNRQNFKFNGRWFKTGEIAPMVSSTTQQLAWDSTKKCSGFLQHDVDSINKLFARLGFNVKVCYNLTKAGIDSQLKRIQRHFNLIT